MRVVGTAGHVDHGKSTLVRALTGIDPDRLQEEKARGMTLDLGFAWMDVPLFTENLTENVIGPATASRMTVGIVDVPGHLDFIKNMLAGVGGIDAAILVVAADEGVMPQTREHLAILDLLAVPTTLVALTKTDAVDDPEWLDLVELDIATLLEPTRFARAPVVRVSALQGMGLDELRTTTGQVLGQLAPRRNRRRPLLQLDRIFTISGFGTVVTGTLSDGDFSVGDGVEILPGGLHARIRGMQSHQQSVTTAQPGTRVALNLTGVGTEQLRRGNVVALPGTLQPTLLLDVHFRLVPQAPKPLKHNQLVDLFIGAAEVPARARVLGVEQIEPGQAGWLQLRLQQPIVAAAGDHYILRQPSPSITLGGGVVLNAQPRRRWRRFDPIVLAQLAVLARGAPDEVVLQALERQPFSSSQQLWASSGLDVGVAQQVESELRATGAVVALALGSDVALLTATQWEAALHTLTQTVGDYHAQYPLRRGMPRGEARSRLTTFVPGGQLTPRLFNAWVVAAEVAERLQADEQLLWLPNHTIQLQPAQQQQVAHALKTLANAQYAPPAADEILAFLGQDRELLDYLIAGGQLVRVGTSLLYRRQEVEDMLAQITTHLQQQGTITLAEVRDQFDTSRKYAQAVLEELDARRITRREGDARALRNGST